MEKLVRNLPTGLKKEIMSLWLDYEKGTSLEGKFFEHADRMEGFLQASEYGRDDKKFPQKPFWVQADELHDDPVLLKFIEQVDEEFHKKTKKKK